MSKVITMFELIERLRNQTTIDISLEDGQLRLGENADANGIVFDKNGMKVSQDGISSLVSWEEIDFLKKSLTGQSNG